jgi:hyperosmotically inducible protein
MRNLGCWKMTLLATILAAPLVAGCGKTIGETIDDTTITTRVKTAMLNDPAVGGLGIDVDTYKGVVTLSGRVKSPAEHDQGWRDRGQGRAAGHPLALSHPSVRISASGTPSSRRLAAAPLTRDEGPQMKHSVEAGSCSTASK